MFVGRPRAAIVVAVVALAVLGPAAVAHALWVADSKSEAVPFTGAGCGDKDNAILALPRGARKIEVRSPEAGDVFDSAIDNVVVAELVGTRISGHRVIVTVRGSDDVCDNPANYADGGWSTDDVTIGARYQIQRSVRAFGRCGVPGVRPHTIVIACGDGNLYLDNLRWHKWGGPVATATGVVAYNDCDPFCAAGHFHRKPATVRLSRPRYCADASTWVYLKLRTRGTGIPAAGADWDGYC